MNNNLDKQYTDLLQDILENGTKKMDRTGTGTISVFGKQIRHKMSEGFPLLTSKKMYFKGVVTELLWFLKGDTNIKYLVDNGCNIWTGDAHKRYRTVYEIESREGDKYLEELHMLSNLSIDEFSERIKTDDEFANKWGELGPIYGKQWRNWNGIDREAFFNSDNLDERNRDARHGMFYKESEIDQIANSINLLKTDPDSRRNRVNAWNVGELDQMVLPPCHTDFQFFTRKLTFDERYKIYTGGDKTWEEGGGNSFGKISGLDIMDDNNIPTRSISLMWNQRSVDTPLGLPFNIASYGLLLEIIGKIVNMVPDELIGNLGDTHIYLNQIDGVKEQITRGSFELPKLVHLKTDDYYRELSEGLSLLTHLDPEDFTLENYQSHSKIDFPLSN
jgi:thymidylate synthase